MCGEVSLDGSMQRGWGDKRIELEGHKPPVVVVSIVCVFLWCLVGSSKLRGTRCRRMLENGSCVSRPGYSFRIKNSDSS